MTYADALRTGGRAPAPGDDMRSPRTPGGSHVPVTVGRNAAASAQHSPTILAGGASPHDPFTSPLRPADHGGAAGAGVPRKIRCGRRERQMSLPPDAGTSATPCLPSPTDCTALLPCFCSAALSSSVAARPQQCPLMPPRCGAVKVVGAVLVFGPYRSVTCCSIKQVLG